MAKKKKGAPADLDLGVAHAVGRWSAAAAWNARYIEPEAWRLRVGPRDPSP